MTNAASLDSALARISRHRAYLIGVSFSLLYVLAGSGGDVLTAAILQERDTATILFLAFTLVFLVFLAIAISRGDWRIDWRNWRDFFALNVTTASSWIFLFYGLKYIEPAIANALVFAVGPLFTLAGVNLLVRRGSTSRWDLVTCIGIVVSGAFLAWVALSGHSSKVTTVPSSAIAGVVLSIGCGLALSLNTIFTKRLRDGGCAEINILAHRFYLLLATLPTFIEAGLVSAYLHEIPLEILAITALNVFIPIIAIQRAVSFVDPLTIGVVISITPATTYAFQLLDARLDLSVYTLAGNVVIVLFVLTSVVTSFRRAEK